MQIGKATLENDLAIFSEGKKWLCGPAISFLGIYHKDMLKYVYKKRYVKYPSSIVHDWKKQTNEQQQQNSRPV